MSVSLIKNTIAIASGKGGVGKSTTAVNLALALQLTGARVGILDADIYGPSLALMLGVKERPIITEEKKMRPVKAHDLQTMSIGYLVDEKTPMVWRGPMATGALLQLFNDTLWDHLDFLIIDLPPGTGDIQLTLAQKIPLTGAIIVTTPQDLALLDAKRAYEMFSKVKVPILGVIENMSIHICSQCQHSEAIFGEGGGQKMADQYDLPLLGALPLDKKIRTEIDRGTPTVVNDRNSAIAKLYFNIANKILEKLHSKGETDKPFPKIIIQND